MFFIMYKSQILVKAISVNSRKVHLLHLKRSEGSMIFETMRDRIWSSTIEYDQGLMIKDGNI